MRTIRRDGLAGANSRMSNPRSLARESRGDSPALLAWIVLVLLCAAASAGAAAAATLVLPPIYASEARLLVGLQLAQGNPEYQDVLAAQLLAQAYAELALTDAYLERIGAETAAARATLRELIQVDAPRESTILRIVAEASSPPEAAELANALADELAAAGPGRAAVVTRADLSQSPVAPRPGLAAVLGAIAGIFVGIGLAFVSEYLRRERMRSA